jgi:ribosome biogenesis GTPase
VGGQDESARVADGQVEDSLLTNTRTVEPRRGRVLPGFGGFYYIQEDRRAIPENHKDIQADHKAEQILWECRLRGRFRRENQEVLPGDLVAFAPVNELKRKGVVERVLPRKNRLLRPPVANVDQALVVLAMGWPPPDLWLLDRLLLMIFAEGIEPLLCWNKEDLAGDRKPAELMAPYEAAGIPQLVTCALTGQGIDALSGRLAGKATVLAGASGVGKSSLLNRAEPSVRLKTGEISDKLGRGKHTTRHVEWIPLSIGGWLADTPGFSRIFLPETINAGVLGDYYPEFAPHRADCRFRSCLHHQEQDCRVRQAVEEKEIDGGRYQRYVTFLREIQERDKKF